MAPKSTVFLLVGCEAIRLYLTLKLWCFTLWLFSELGTQQPMIALTILLLLKVLQPMVALVHVHD